MEFSGPILIDEILILTTIRITIYVDGYMTYESEVRVRYHFHLKIEDIYIEIS